MKKGRHRRFEEARALKRNQEMDFDSILESLASDDESEIEGEGHSPAIDDWASDLEEGASKTKEENSN